MGVERLAPPGTLIEQLVDDGGQDFRVVVPTPPVTALDFGRSEGHHPSMTEDSGLAQPAPAFAAHFTDPIYEDVSNDFTPFGSDEGWDMLATWDERRDELGPESTVADILEGDPAGYLADDDVDAALMVQSAGFTLLRLTGHIDEAGRKATLEALALLQSVSGESAELEQQVQDLTSWAE